MSAVRTNIPPRSAEVVTPSDTTQFGPSLITHYGAAGQTISVVTEGGQTVNFVNLPIGHTLPVLCVRVRATGTSSTSVVRSHTGA